MQRARSTLLAQVVRTIAAHRMLAPGARVLVAVSGGPDSVGLLAILAVLRRRLAVDLVAAHVNHRLRGADSDADEQSAAAAAARAQVPFVRADLAGLGRGGNLEARARALRYHALHRLAAATDCARIATGHTRDDQAETVLLRLVRGSGLAGLAGIEPVRADGVIRPLLECRRRAVASYIHAAGYGFRTDASNRDARFLRTRVRHALLPLLTELNPAIVDHLAHIATLSVAEKTIVETWTAERLQEMQDDGALNVERLRGLAPALHRHIVRAWLLSTGVAPVGLTARHVDAVTRLALGRQPGGEVRLRAGVIARRYGRLQRGRTRARGVVAPYPLAPGEAVVLPGGWRIEVGPVEPRRTRAVLPADLWTAVCDATALSDALVVRPARVGERVRPLGLGGKHRKVSDLFIDRKVPAGDRRTYPVVSHGDEIVWVPGLIRGEPLRVGERTAKVLHLRARREPGAERETVVHLEKSAAPRGKKTLPGL